MSTAAITSSAALAAMPVALPNGADPTLNVQLQPAAVRFEIQQRTDARSGRHRRRAGVPLDGRAVARARRERRLLLSLLRSLQGARHLGKRQNCVGVHEGLRLVLQTASP